MGIHKHGVFSFQVSVERMVVIGGDNFIAEVTALRRHGPSGTAERLPLPPISEQYGQTAPQAEARVIIVMRDWLDDQLGTASGPKQARSSSAMP